MTDLYHCRAEVGLLSHNVIVQGSVLNSEPGFNGWGADMYGAQILVHRAGPNPTPIRYIACHTLQAVVRTDYCTS